MTEGQPDFSKMTPQEIAEYQKKNCIFCKIIAGEIPSKKVYEDEAFFAILDINPVTKGHVLLLPKEHVQVMPQMNPELTGKLAIATQKISKKLIASTGCKGTTVFIANGAVAGQKAPHFLAHIIPRKNNDDLPLNPKFKKQEDNEWTQIHKKVYKSIYGTEPKEEDEEQNQIKKEDHNKPTEDTKKTEEETEETDAEDNDTSEENEEYSNKPDLDKIAKLFK